MVTIRPIPKTEVRCNACNVLIGYLIIDEPGAEAVLEYELIEGTFQRFRMYDVINDGEPLNDKLFEVDLCNECTGKFDKIIKKFKLNKSSVKRRANK